jgi:hypothetical protein
MVRRVGSGFQSAFALWLMAFVLLCTAGSGIAFATSKCSCVGPEYMSCNKTCTGGKSACCGCGGLTSSCICCDSGESCTSSNDPDPNGVGTAECS